MEWILLVALILWLFSRSIKKQAKKLEQDQEILRSARRDMTPRNEQGYAANENDLGFVEAGKAPNTDQDGRVIVKVLSGKVHEIGFNLKHLDEDLAKKIAGKRGADDEFTRRIKVRIFRDTESPYFNSFKVLTKSGEFIGWVLKDDSEMMALLLSKIEAGIKPLSAKLHEAEFVIEASATFNGSWYDEIDEDDAGNEIEVEYVEMDEAFIRIGDPAMLEID